LAIVSAVSIPFVHIVEVTADAIGDAGLNTVRVLGTQATMEGAFYRERLRDHGINVVVPTTADREAVERIVFEELTNGTVRDASRERYLEVIDGMVTAGTEGVVLGCTELDLLVDQTDRPGVSLFDTTALHVERAVEHSLGEPIESRNVDPPSRPGTSIESS
jgi:aspartate racemase